jgi:hypothetical protein
MTGGAFNRLTEEEWAIASSTERIDVITTILQLVIVLLKDADFGLE